MKVIFNNTDDNLSARLKLADYFRREFTEISLYSPGEREKEKVPLRKLYVPMEWKRIKNLVFEFSCFKIMFITYRDYTSYNKEK